MKKLDENSIRLHPAPQDGQVLVKPGVLHPTDEKVQVMNSMTTNDKSLSILPNGPSRHAPTTLKF